MLHIYGLVLTAVICSIAAETTPEDLRKEIATMEQEIILIRQKIQQLKDEADRRQKEFEATISQTSLENVNLTREEGKLLEKMYELNITTSVLEHYIEEEKRKLATVSRFGYRLEFIRKLLKDDLALLDQRRKSGDEQACFAFSKNRTEILPDPGARGVSVRGLTPQDRLVRMLQNKLNKVKLELAQAQIDLELQQTRLIEQSAFLKKEMLTIRDLQGKLKESINEAKGAIVEFEKDIEEKKAEESALHKKYLFEKKKHQYLMDQVVDLKKRISEFSKASNCYNEMGNERF